MKHLRFGRIACLMAILPILLCICTLPSFAAPEDYSDQAPALLNSTHLYGKNAICIDQETGDILFQKNPHTRVFPASTTKIMTLLLAIESGWDMDLTVQIPAEAANVPADSSLVPVYRGETMSFQDLLYGMMLHSGNDAANAVAVLVSGSIPAFVERMNARAEELGCTETHFANAHGYQDVNHYTSAADLAIITREAMKHEEIRTIASTYSYTMHIQPRGELPLRTTNSMIIPTSTYYYEDCIGLKTGTTSQAGKCFVGVAEKDGAMVITVTLGSETDAGKWTDTKRLFNYGFTRYNSYNLERMFELTSDRIVAPRVSNASRTDPSGGVLPLKLAQISDPDYVRLMMGDSEEIVSASMDDFIERCQVTIVDQLVAPIPEGKLVGNFSYTAQDGSVITAALIAAREVEAEPDRMTIYDLFPFLGIFNNPLVQLLVLILLLLIAVIIIHSIASRKRQERHRRELYEQRRREYAQREQSARKKASRKYRDRYDDLFDD